MSRILNFIRSSFLGLMKLSSYLIYPSKLTWVGPPPEDWTKVSLVLVLNHTSLIEFLLGVMFPFKFLNQIAMRLIMPVADKTLNDPYFGPFFKHLAPKTISLTRKRDQSWDQFLNQVDANDLCIFMPEGRMKRLNGLDKDGNKMSVKTGVYDLMQRFHGQQMLLVYSKGLHHVLPPGRKLPKLFKKIEAKAEVLSISNYLQKFSSELEPWKKVALDLEKRRDKYIDLTN